MMLQREGIAPTYEDYPDTGCRLWPKCLTCPFPVCLVEELGAAMSHVDRQTKEKKPARNAEIRACAQDGMKAKEIAIMFGITRTRVHQILRSEGSSPLNEGREPAKL